MSTRLQDVFGINEEVRAASYVDRGGLDSRVKYLLNADRHIVIHGESRQGKSWLRKRLLSPDRIVHVQCVAETSPERLLEQALGAVGAYAELRRSSDHRLSGQIKIGGEFSAGGILAKFSARTDAKAKGEKGALREEQAVAQYPGNLEWVARLLKASNKRVVFEDFHYLRDDHRRVIAGWMKALWEYQLYVVVVGVWPESHLLTYYNGDLTGRIEEVQLSWTKEELNEVLERGCKSLNIEMSRPLRDRLTSASYSNVGLLQRLAERLCYEEGILEAPRSRKNLELGARSLAGATGGVAEGARARFEGFARSLVQGGRLGARSPLFHVLRSFLSFEDEELLEGIALRELTQRVEADSPGRLSRRAIVDAAKGVERIQERLRIRPPVLLYSSDTHRLHVADRELLFFRRFAETRWPWEELDLDEAETEPLF